MSKEWFRQIHSHVLERNAKQTTPFIDVIDSNQKLWVRYVFLENRRLEARHKIASIEHDVQQKNDAVISLGSIRSELEKVQSELVAFEAYSCEDTYNRGNSKKLRSELSFTVFEQKKLIANQIEEIVVAKSEIRDAHSRLLVVEGERNALMLEMEILKRERITADEEISKLRLENDELTKRIVCEKDKTASQMNEMYELVDGMKSPNSQSLIEIFTTTSNVGIKRGYS